MAFLLSRATGDWTNAATWAVLEPVMFIPALSESATTALTTTYAISSTLTTGAITIDAIGVRLANRTGVTGTISVALDQAGATVTGTEVTINVADLPPAITASLDGGWIVFKFAAPVTLAASTLYSVKAKTSSAAMVSLHSFSTTNWSRFLRTTTTQAPVAGDDMYIAGEFTGAGTSNSFTVTMNETAATDYGSAPTATNALQSPGVSISTKGTLKWNDASAANPLLRLSNSIVVYNGGTLNMGTTATPIPRDSRAILEFDQLSADGDYGLAVRNGGTFTGQGLSRTSGKNIVSCKLTADAAASGGSPSTSTLTVDTDTGWLAGDQIAIASTSRTAADCETGTLNADAGASSIVVKDMTAAVAGMAVPPTSNRGLLVAHSGTTPTQAEIILLTRNVVIRSTSATLVAFVNVVAGGIADLDWVQFYYLGENVANKRGIEIAASTTLAVNFDMQYCSIHDCEDIGVYFSGTGAVLMTKMIIAYCTLWNLGTVLGPGVTLVAAITPTNWIVDNNILIRTLNLGGFTLADVGGTFTNNTVVGATGVGITASEAGSIIGTFAANVAHSNGTNGIVFAGNSMSGVAAACATWRNNSIAGFGVTGAITDFLVSDLISFGNSAANITISGLAASIRFTAPVLNGDTTFATTTGLNINAFGLVTDITIDNGDFSTITGIKTTHTQDIAIVSLCEPLVTMRNTKLGSNTEVASPGFISERGYISSQKHDRVAGNHMTWMRNGKISTDTSIFRTTSPSLRMTPSMAAHPVINLITVTATVLSAILTAVPAFIANWAQVGDWIATSIGFTGGARITGVGPTSIVLDRYATSSSAAAQLTLYRGTLASAPPSKGFQIAVLDAQACNVGVWVRKQQENMFLYSEDFSQGGFWTASNATPTVGQTDWVGGTSATKFLETVANVNTHGLARAAAVTLVSQLVYVWSFYVKGGLGRQWLRIEEGSAPRESWIDVTNGVAGTTHAAHTINITVAGSGWYRVAVTFIPNSTSSTPKIYTATADNVSTAFVGDVTKGFLTGAWQLETGSTVCAYQITTIPGINGYDGHQPRLMQRANPALGIANDVVLDTMSGPNGVWEQLTGVTTAPSGDAGVIELYVDCDGMAGWINVDDFTVS